MMPSYLITYTFHREQQQKRIEVKGESIAELRKAPGSMSEFDKGDQDDRQPAPDRDPVS